MSYTALSLFAGCGGFCEGVRLAGFSVQAAVEWDRFAAQTYRLNFPEVPLFEDDIASFLMDGDDKWEQAAPQFRDALSEPTDLVFGGPPCQGFSQIGTRLLDDPRNQLYSEYVRVLEERAPRVFLMENVPNMLLLARGRFKTEIVAALRAAGYSNTVVRVVSSDDFGVPQVRRRVVIFGVRDDLAFPFDAGQWMDSVLGSLRRPAPTVWDAIGDLPESVSVPGVPLEYPKTRRRSGILSELRLDRDGDLYTAAEKTARAGGLRLHNHHTKDVQERRRLIISLLRPGLKGDSLPDEVWSGARPEKWRRLHPDKPAYTILAQMHRDLSEWVHPEYDRWITVREAARLQSFHDGFVFGTSEWQMLKQVGNAVPPLMGYAVAELAARTLKVLDRASWTEEAATLAAQTRMDWPADSMLVAAAGD